MTSSLLEQFVAEYNVKALRQIAGVARQHYRYLDGHVPIDQAHMFFRIGNDLERLALMAEKAQASMPQEPKAKTNGG